MKSQASLFALPQHYPGADDSYYCHRRQEIFLLAFYLRMNRQEDVPAMAYTRAENQLWARAVAQLALLHAQHAVAAYRCCKASLHLNERRVPQLGEVIRQLQGFTLIAAEGLLPLSTFYSYLSRGAMPITLFLRHPKALAFTPEPDLIHDMLGHVPLLLDSTYQQILACLGHLGEQLAPAHTQHWERLYWHTIETGLMREKGQLKIYGAALLTSPADAAHALSRNVDHCPFDLTDIMRQPVDYETPQQRFYVIESFEQLLHVLQTYLQALRNPETREKCHD